MGTDADGNAAVTVSRGGKPGSLRIETKGYTVKGSPAFSIEAAHTLERQKVTPRRIAR